ncbi:hypothetical protein LMG28690_00473 [Paraburkholderia caffeinilytica]|nr:hypothetical protein LMG28690_00473 [Paraburkholderia caffeinilytica]
MRQTAEIDCIPYCEKMESGWNAYSNLTWHSSYAFRPLVLFGKQRIIRDVFPKEGSCESDCSSPA